MEQPFRYGETYQPPPGQGYTRYASADLVRSEDRRHWVNNKNQVDEQRFVMDDFGYLKYIPRSHYFLDKALN